MAENSVINFQKFSCKLASQKEFIPIWEAIKYVHTNNYFLKEVDIIVTFRWNQIV